MYNCCKSMLSAKKNHPFLSFSLSIFALIFWCILYNTTSTSWNLEYVLPLNLFNAFTSCLFVCFSFFAQHSSTVCFLFFYSLFKFFLATFTLFIVIAFISTLAITTLKLDWPIIFRYYFDDFQISKKSFGCWELIVLVFFLFCITSCFLPFLNEIYLILFALLRMIIFPLCFHVKVMYSDFDVSSLSHYLRISICFVYINNP